MEREREIQRLLCDKERMLEHCAARRCTSWRPVWSSGHAAGVVGLDIGNYHESRPLQARLPIIAREQIDHAYAKAGLAKQPAPA